MIPKEIKQYLARFVRRLTIRGRGDFAEYDGPNPAGPVYSCEGYRASAADQASATHASRFQHYGFVSEAPDGADCIALPLGGEAAARVSVAEDWSRAPKAAALEVMLYCEHGQRVHLTKDGDVFVYPKSGRNVYIGDSVTGNCDRVVTFTELKTQFDSLVQKHNDHYHAVGSYAVGGSPVVGTSGGVLSAGNIASDLTDAVASSNVYAKK